MTNDVGEYRIYDLSPGRYYLKAAPQQMMGGRSDTDQSFASAYYPGPPDAAAAAPVDIGAGQQLRGMDLTLRPLRVANIRGHIANPGSNPMVGLISFQDGGGSTSTNTSVENPDGKFELRGVTPGPYVLTAQGTIGGQHYSAHVPIQVGTADMEGFELHLLPPVEITGQIRIEGKTSDKLSQMDVVLEGEGRSVESAAGGTKEDGAFTLEGLEPGVYQISVNAPEDLYLKSVRWGERDVMQSGLDLTQGGAGGGLIVVMSANRGQVEGVVEDDQSTPAVAAVVALVPSVPSGAPASKSLFKVAKTNPEGHFRMQAIAPGSYKLFAWEDADPSQVMYDPDFLKPFDAQGESVEIAEGSRKSVQLTPIKSAAP